MSEDDVKRWWEKIMHVYFHLIHMVSGWSSIYNRFCSCIINWRWTNYETNRRKTSWRLSYSCSFLLSRWWKYFSRIYMEVDGHYLVSIHIIVWWENMSKELTLLSLEFITRSEISQSYPFIQIKYQLRWRFKK